MRAANQADTQGRAYPIRTLARLLDVSASGYYDWRDRESSARAVDNALLAEAIEQIHEASKAIYGEPKIRAELRDESVPEHDAKFANVGKHRVARLMRARGLQGVCKRRSYTVTTERNKKARPAPDLVERAFVADAPNQLWVADMTYVPTWAGFIYLAIVLDVWSRRIVGWAIGETMEAALVVSALNMALSMRVPNGGAGLIHHSDQSPPRRRPAVASTRASHSANDVLRWKCALPSAASGTPMTMRWLRTSLRVWNVSCWSAPC